MEKLIPADRHSEFLKDSLVAIVQSKTFDMTTRQLAIFMICYINDGPHTVRGIAASHKLPKPTVSRAFDKLEDENLMTRRPDSNDRRSIIVIGTAKGDRFLQELMASVTQASGKK